MFVILGFLVYYFLSSPLYAVLLYKEVCISSGKKSSEYVDPMVLVVQLDSNGTFIKNGPRELT